MMNIEREDIKYSQYFNLKAKYRSEDAGGGGVGMATGAHLRNADWLHNRG